MRYKCEECGRTTTTDDLYCRCGGMLCESVVKHHTKTKSYQQAKIEDTNKRKHNNRYSEHVQLDEEWFE